MAYQPSLHRHKHGLAATVLILFGLVYTAAAQPESGPVVQWLSTGQESSQRIATGRNIQAIVSIPSARQPDGDLLDPSTVEVIYDGRPLDHFVFYKKNDIALVFVLPPEDPDFPAEIRLTGKTVKGDTIKAPVLQAGAVVHARTSTVSRQLRLQSANGAPLVDAFYFGQRHLDLFAKASSEGVVELNAPFRHTPGSHYAWAAGYWSEQFDPVTSPTLTLAPREVETEHTVSIRIFTSGSSELSQAVILHDSHVYTVYKGGFANYIKARKGKDTEAFVIAAGYPVKRFVIPSGEAAVTVTLSE